MSERQKTILKTLEGVMIGYRKGPKTLNSGQYLIKFHGIETVNEAARLIGRKVAWPVKERRCRGKIVALHGKNGIVRARFRRGMPGQALGSHVEIIG